MIEPIKLPGVGRPNGGRLGNRKVRTGCLTCKKRKIKCDEGFPACLRCTSTGRHCDGYVDPYGPAKAGGSGSGSRTPSPPRAAAGGPSLSSSWSGALAFPGAGRSSPPGRLLAEPARGEAEHRALAFFATVGVRRIAGPADVNLWSRLMPQLMHAMPAVRHAAVAVGSLLLDHELAGAGGGGGAGPLRANALAIAHYHHAIQATRRAINDGRGNAVLAGATCILFFCIEALQGNETEALHLYQRARAAFLRPKQGAGAGSRGWGGNATDTTAADLADVFSRLAIQYVMFQPGINPESEDILARLEGPLESVAQAQTELVDLLTMAFNITSVGFEIKWGLPELPALALPRLPELAVPGEAGGVPLPAPSSRDEALLELELRRRTLSAGFDLWDVRYVAYRRACGLRTPQPTPEESAVWLTLRLRCQATAIWLAGSTARAETVFDAHELTFRELVAEGEEVIDLMERCCEKSRFTFELNVIAPLYIVVQKCRDPVLRRRALALLRRAPAQEGLWYRDIIVQVAQRTIELEEGTDGFVEFPPPALAGMVVPEERRLKLVSIGPRTLHEDGREGDFVDFYSRPYGLDGEWNVMREFFVVERLGSSRRQSFVGAHQPPRHDLP